MTRLIGTLAIVVLSAGMAGAQNPSAPDSKRPAETPTAFKGCLQGDSTKGFALLTATGDGSGSDTKGQTMTYKVEAPATIDLSRHVNKIVEVSGTLALSKTGSMPAPVPDTVRGTAGAGGTGKPGENTAFYYANGTVTAKAVREIAATCALRSVPKNVTPR